LIENESWGEVIDFTASAVKKFPRDGELFFYRARALCNLGRLDEALVAATQSIEYGGGYPSTYTQRANIYDNLGCSEKALADYDKALELDRKYHMALIERSTCRRRRGEYDLAWADIDEALAIAPHDAMARREHMLLSGESGNMEGVLADFEILRKSGSLKARDYVARVRAMCCMELPATEVLPAAVEATMRNPEDGEAWFHRGVAERLSGDAEAALKSLDKAINASPEMPPPWFERSKLMEDAENFQEALNSLEEAVRLAGEAEYDDRLRRGVLLCLLGRHEDALAELKSLEAECPDSGDVLFWQAETLFWLKRFDEAAAMYEKSLCHECGFPRSYIEYRLAYSLSMLEKHEEALELVCRSLNATPDDSDAHLLYGMLLLILERDEAERELARALDMAADETERAGYITAIAELRKNMAERETSDPGGGAK